MSLSTCLKCGGRIPLGPKASNRCEDCGEFVFSGNSTPMHPLPVCPRCCKVLSGDPGSVHTCTPTPLVRGLEVRITELEQELMQARAEIRRQTLVNESFGMLKGVMQP